VKPLNFASSTGRSAFSYLLLRILGSVAIIRSKPINEVAVGLWIKKLHLGHNLGMIQHKLITIINKQEYFCTIIGIFCHMVRLLLVGIVFFRIYIYGWV
jgi:hypothetical protein